MKLLIFLFIFYIPSAFGMDLSKTKPEVSNEQNGELINYLKKVSSWSEKVRTSIDAFLEKGASIKGQNDEGLTPLHVAVQIDLDLQAGQKKTMLVEYLIKKGADVNAPDGNGCKPLYCVGSGLLDIMICLINHGADVFSRDDKGNTLFHHLAEKVGLLDVMYYNSLRGNGINLSFCQFAKLFDPCAKNHLGETPLHTAVWHNNGLGVTFLRHLKAPVCAINALGRTPLHYAAIKGTCFSELLIEVKGADSVDVTARDSYGCTALHYAAKNGHIFYPAKGRYDFLIEKLIQLLGVLDRKKSFVNARCNNGVSPLHEAAYEGHAKACIILISNDADVNAKDNNGISPLTKAAENGHAKVCTTLISNGADVNAKDIH